MDLEFARPSPPLYRSSKGRTASLCAREARGALVKSLQKELAVFAKTHFTWIKSCTVVSRHAGCVRGISCLAVRGAQPKALLRGSGKFAASSKPHVFLRFGRELRRLLSLPSSPLKSRHVKYAARRKSTLPKTRKAMPR